MDSIVGNGYPVRGENPFQIYGSHGLFLIQVFHEFHLVDRYRNRFSPRFEEPGFRVTPILGNDPPNVSRSDSLLIGETPSRPPFLSIPSKNPTQLLVIQDPHIRDF